VLLDGLAAAGLERFVAVEVSEAALRGALPGLVERYPAVAVVGAVADFERQLGLVEAPGPRLVAFLGSTIGALDPDERVALLVEVARFIGPDGAFLFGADLVKPLERILAAYDHADGLGEALTLNLLSILNREVGADFRLERFDTVGSWNPDEERLESCVRSLADQTVAIPGAGVTLELHAGDTIRTQISTKFRRERVDAELAAAGLTLREWWIDDDGAYALGLAGR
jgi:L-histidine N-alpha-methyltransferase